MPAMAAPLLRNPTPTPSRAPSSAAAAAHATAQPPPPRTAQSNAHHAPHLYSVAFSETGKTVSTFLYSQCIYLNMQNTNILRGKSLSLNRLISPPDVTAKVEAKERGLCSTQEESSVAMAFLFGGGSSATTSINIADAKARATVKVKKQDQTGRAQLPRRYCYL